MWTWTIYCYMHQPLIKVDYIDFYENVTDDLEKEKCFPFLVDFFVTK